MVKVRWDELAFAVKCGGLIQIYLLDGGDGGTAGNNVGEDVTLHGDTKGKGNNVEEEHVGGVGGGGLAGEDTGLDGGTVGDSLVGVDALLELLTTEVVGQKLLDLGDTGRATNEDDLVNLALVDLGILYDLGHRVDGSLECLVVDRLEPSVTVSTCMSSIFRVILLSASDLAVEVFSLEERVDLHSGLGTV